MDREKWKKAFQKMISPGGKGGKKPKGVTLLCLLGAVGVVLIFLSSLLPSGGQGEEVKAAEADGQSAEEYAAYLEEKLRRVVTSITGEDSPEVLVTLESGRRLLYATDEAVDSQSEEQDSREERKTTHVLLKTSDGAQQALTVTEIQPEVKGVVIVSSRAGEPVIREKLTDAVRTALDISAARVCVTDTG